MTTETNNTNENPYAKMKSVEDFPSSELFADLQAAAPYVEAISVHAAKHKIPVHVYGVRFENGQPVEVTKEWPADANGIPFAVDVTRLQYKTEIGKEEDGSAVNGWRTKAIIAMPVPTFDQLMSDKAGREIVEAAAAREVRARAVRALRAAEDEKAIALCVDNLPKSIAELAQSSRTGTGGAYGSFNAVWQPVLQFFEGKVKALAAIRIKKEDLRHALSNAAYASAMFPALEALGLFEKMLSMMVAYATRDGLNVDTLTAWAANRANETYSEDDIDLDDLGLDDLLAARSAEADESVPEPAIDSAGGEAESAA